MTRNTAGNGAPGRGILVLNAGSSSVKFALFVLTTGDADPQMRLRGQVSGIGREPVFSACDAAGRTIAEDNGRLVTTASDHRMALDYLLDWIRRHMAGIELAAVGHRVVHGGRMRTEPARITAELLLELDGLSPLAPHHQPHNVAAIRLLEEHEPSLPQVACFDTAFHARQDDIARRLPLPSEYAGRGLMRYGFHGLSYEYITSTVAAFGDAGAPPRLLIAHLGNGASLCAVRHGRSVATTMGFSTLDGLMMGTRSGSIDPGVLLHLMREDGMGEPALSDLLYNRSGLLGVSGISADMQQLLNSQAPGAREAVDLYCLTLVKQMGSMLAVLEGADAIVFTGGIGEHAAPVRAAVCARLGWLGVVLDESANAANASRISHSDSALPVLVIPTNEELVIARHTAKLLHPATT